VEQGSGKPSLYKWFQISFTQVQLKKSTQVDFFSGRGIVGL